MERQATMIDAAMVLKIDHQVCHKPEIVAKHQIQKSFQDISQMISPNSLNVSKSI